MDKITRNQYIYRLLSLVEDIENRMKGNKNSPMLIVCKPLVPQKDTAFENRGSEDRLGFLTCVRSYMFYYFIMGLFKRLYNRDIDGLLKKLQKEGIQPSSSDIDYYSYFHHRSKSLVFHEVKDSIFKTIDGMEVWTLRTIRDRLRLCI